MGKTSVFQLDLFAELVEEGPAEVAELVATEVPSDPVPALPWPDNVRLAPRPAWASGPEWEGWLGSLDGENCVSRLTGTCEGNDIPRMFTIYEWEGQAVCWRTREVLPLTVDEYRRGCDREAAKLGGWKDWLAPSPEPVTVPPPAPKPIGLGWFGRGIGLIIDGEPYTVEWAKLLSDDTLRLSLKVAVGTWWLVNLTQSGGFWCHATGLIADRDGACIEIGPLLARNAAYRRLLAERCRQARAFLQSSAVERESPIWGRRDETLPEDASEAETLAYAQSRGFWPQTTLEDVSALRELASAQKALREARR